MANFDFTDPLFCGICPLKVFRLLAKNTGRVIMTATFKSWVQLFPSVTCVLTKISCEKEICDSCVPWILVSFHALASWAFSNPSQSPMLAHCSVHEWVTAGSERWKVYCGADPDTAHCYLSISTAMATVLGLRLCIINNERNAWVCFCCFFAWKEHKIPMSMYVRPLTGVNIWYSLKVQW